MSQVLTNDQVNQVVQNTMVVILARPDLLPDWNANLTNLLQQSREASLEDETFFVAAVLTLLHSPKDTLPTGTIYDHAWRALLTALQTGVIQSADRDTEAVTVDRLLASVAEGVVRIIKEAPQHKGVLANEIREMRSAAVEANISELVAWLDDTLALLAGQELDTLGASHSDLYAEFWQFIRNRL